MNVYWKERDEKSRQVVYTYIYVNGDFIFKTSSFHISTDVITNFISGAFLSIRERSEFAASRSFLLMYLWILFKTGKIFCRFLFLFLLFSPSTLVRLSLRRRIARSGFPMLAVDSNRGVLPPRPGPLASIRGSQSRMPYCILGSLVGHLIWKESDAPLAHPLSTRDQRPSKRTVTYRPCMPRISVHHYVSLESESRAPFPRPSRRFENLPA